MVSHETKKAQKLAAMCRDIDPVRCSVSSSVADFLRGLTVRTYRSSILTHGPLTCQR